MGQSERETMPRRWPAWRAPILLTLLTILMFAPLLFGDRVLYLGTPMLQFVPWRQAAAEQLKAGWLPLWLQGVGAGAPLLANHQTAALYPLNILFLVWPAERALSYSAALHVLLAGLGMFWLARSLRLSRFAALIGAIAYMFSAFIITRLMFPSMTCAAAWMPYLWLFGGRLAERRRMADALALALVIGLQFLAGHAQLWYYSMWALALYVLARCLIGRRDDGAASWPARRQARAKPLAITLSLTLLALALGVGLAAAQFLPTAELAMNSQRQTGAEYDFAMTYSLWPWRLITFFAPDFFGSPAHGDYWGYGNYWEDAGYVGVLPLLLVFPAILGWRAGRKTGKPALRLVPFLFGFGLLALLLALGKNLPLYPAVFRYVPGFGLFQAPARFLYWTTLALALLAAIGADQLTVWAGRGKAARWLLVIGVGLFLGGLAALILLPAIKVTFGPALLRAGLLLGLSSLPIILSAAPPRPGWRGVTVGAWPALAVLILAGDLLSFGISFNPTTTPAAYAPFENRTADLLRDDASGQFRIYTFEKAEYDIMYRRYHLFKDFGDSSLARQRELRETLLPNVHLLDGIESAGNFEPLLDGRYARLMDVINTTDTATALRLLGLMNVAYIVQPQFEAPGVAGVVEIGAGEELPTRVYRNPAALPRAWWTPKARCVANDEAALAAIQEPAFDPRQEVILSCAKTSEVSKTSEVFLDVPVTLTYRPNGVTIALNAPAAGYLVLADAWYPGWDVAFWAGSEARPAELLRANYAFRAVAVEAGEQSVDFHYTSWAAQTGSQYSVLSLLGVLGGFFALRRRRKPCPSDNPRQS